MAKVTIEIEDTVKDGKQVVSVKFHADRQGQEEDAPATDAMMHGLCIARAWQSRALANLMPYICSDALKQRADLAMNALAEKIKAKAANSQAPSEPVSAAIGPAAPAVVTTEGFEKMAAQPPSSA